MRVLAAAHDGAVTVSGWCELQEVKCLVAEMSASILRCLGVAPTQRPYVEQLPQEVSLWLLVFGRGPTETGEKVVRVECEGRDTEGLNVRTDHHRGACCHIYPGFGRPAKPEIVKQRRPIRVELPRHGVGRRR